MKLKQFLSVSSVATAALLTCSSGAQAVSWFGFEGGSLLINSALNGYAYPPDTMGAVGTTQFMETSNYSIRIYDKMTGTVQSSVNSGAFWAAAGLPGGSLGDQRVLFDHYTNRWIATGWGATPNLINIGISDTADAMGGWKATRFAGVSNPTHVADFPTLGMDNKGVYISTNNFNGGLSGTSLFVIPKANLFGGAPSTVGMTTFNTPFPVGPDNGLAIQAAVNWQGNPGNTASVMADSLFDYKQVFYKFNGVNGPGATQATVSSYIAGSEYVAAGDGRQPDGTRTVDTFDSRITGNVVQSNGRLYSAITVDDGTSHAAVRWSVNDADTGAVIETGHISGGGYDYYQGSVAVNEFGQAVIGYNRSGFQTSDDNLDGLADGNISFLARIFETDAGGGLDQSGDDLLLKVSGISDYKQLRWGDFSAVTIDPTNHRTFYAIGEYASQGNVWNTYIASITAVPEPETYALMLAGLAAVTAVARRRRNV